MPLTMFGLNHKSAPVAIREKLAHLCGLAIPGVDGCNLESVPVYTCNRVEVYYSGSAESAKQSFVELLALKNLNYENLSEYFYSHGDEDVARHLFAVASGLDSMIIGENQILHQIKESYRYSSGEGYVGKQLHRLFQKALEVGKRVRNETGISENRVSIASAAVDLARSIFGPLDNSKALIIGAGEMASLVAVHLRERRIKKLLFINRTEAGATELAEKFDGSAHSFEDLEKLLVECDIVISSTAAPHTIISKATMKAVMKNRSERPVFAIDIAVPRDFEPDCQQLDNLYLYDVDDLQNVVNDNLNQRHVEADKARAIVQYEASQFQTSAQAFTVVPMIKALREQAENIRKAELDKYFSQTPDLSEDQKKAAEQFSYSMMNKWLHNQIVGLKARGSADLEQLNLIREILGIPTGEAFAKPIHSVVSSDRKKESA